MEKMECRNDQAKKRKQIPNILINAASFNENSTPGIRVNHYGLGTIDSASMAYVQAVYDIDVEFAAYYYLKTNYAFDYPRPVRISISGTVLKEKACMGVTNGRVTPQNGKWFQEGKVYLYSGKQELTVYACHGDLFLPHLNKIIFQSPDIHPLMINDPEMIKKYIDVTKTTEEMI